MNLLNTSRLFSLTISLFSLFAAACAVASPSVTGPGAEVHALTGAHTRVVWVQGDGTDPRMLGTKLVLMGFDSDDGKGERAILAKHGSYVKPLLTSRGDRIVYSTRVKPGPPEVFVVNWDGTGLRKLADGFAMDLWQSPTDRRDWVYIGVNNDGWGTNTVLRFPLDAPDKREPVWTKSSVSMEGFKVSTDGRQASGLFPWPKAGVAELPDGRVTTFGDGCWPSFTNARGPLCWYFDGAHRNVTMVDVDSRMKWMVNINNAPGFEGAEVFHPRWTNHARILTISGPYNQGGRNQARTGGKQVEVYLGRFSADFSKIEAWARVTKNNGGDSQPDAWIDVARSKVPQRPGGPIGPDHVRAARATPGAPAKTDDGRLVVSVQLKRLGPIPTPQEILPYRHAMVVNEYKVVDVLNGKYRPRGIQIAQWAIRDSRVLPQARKSAGAAFTLTVDKYDAHPELEGERLISDSKSSLPLYYDVTAP
jgi:hypothetical protein